MTTTDRTSAQEKLPRSGLVQLEIDELEYKAEIRLTQSGATEELDWLDILNRCLGIGGLKLHGLGLIQCEH